MAGVKSLVSRLRNRKALSRASANFLSSFAENARIKNFARVYIIGSYDFKKTVATQQKRAAILALGVSRSLGNSPSSFAVIGGGFAGITASATLLKLGHQVTLFEKKGALLPLQRSCHDRYIYPDIYDWPMSEGGNELCIAGVRWRADFADVVCQQVIDCFDEIERNAKGMCSVLVGKTVSRVEEDHTGKETKYTVFDVKEFHHPHFDAVLFAVGFGRERAIPFGSRINGYWDNSTLNYIKGTKEAPSRILISGNGDGGLISILDCALKDFSQPRLLRDFESILTQAVKKKIVEVEAEIRRSAQRGAEYNILRLYDEAFKALFDTWREKLIDLISNETRVTFTGGPTGVFTTGSSILNRFLVYVLLRSRFIELSPQPLDRTMVEETVGRDRLGYRVRWKSGNVEDFDFLIIRYGVNRGFFSDSFPTLTEMLSGQKDYFPSLQLADAVPSDIVRCLESL